MKYFLSALGWVFAKLPERAVDLLCVCVGWLIYAAPFGRARVARANIARAFPDMPEKEIDKTVFESARRMVEMALFVVASPHISTENLRGRVELSDKVKAEFEGFGKNPEPAVLMIPHFAMMETITMFPILVDGKIPPTGVFYRPFDNAGIEEWVRTSRRRFGIEFLSRKKGLHAAVAFLRQNGCVAVLFDQKVFSGTRTLLLDKICYTTELPGILAENTGAAVGAFWAERTGFWRARIDCKRFSSRTIEEITCEGNEWLTEKLRADAVSRYDWLWLHKRWHYVEREGKLLGLRESYKSVVDLALSRMGRSELPRNFRVYITLPDSLGECVSLLPLVRLLRKSRPDAFVSLLAGRENAGVLRAFGVADEVAALPERSEGAFARLSAYRALSRKYPEIHILFADSLLDDLCSRALRSDYSVAIQTSRKRMFANLVYRPEAFSGSEHFALECEACLRKYGLLGEVDYSPIKLSERSAGGETSVAVICGGGGAHAWGVEKWSELIKRLRSRLGDPRFLVFGGEADSRAAFEISKRSEFARIENLAAKYASLADAIGELSQCSLAVAADCGAAHAANALGVPVALICGSTNTVRGGFVFSAPHVEIMPEGCPAQGGGDVRNVEVGAVENAVLSLFNIKNRN